MNSPNIFNDLSKNKVNVKESIGICCIRFNKSSGSQVKKEVLMVCKRYTYAYGDFIHGRYPSDQYKSQPIIMKLLNNMTVEEKIDILSMDFARMWYRVWLNSEKPPFYLIAKNRFDSLLMGDQGLRLKRMISRSQNQRCIWEMPKGRKKTKSEPDMHCAIREFMEETGVSKRMYRFTGIKRTLSWTDDDIRYDNKYYIAIANSMFEPTINFDTNDQIMEISDMRWMSLEDIKCVDVHERMLKFIRPILKLAR